VTLSDEFSPQHEISERHLVAPDEFLDRLFWGRLDPKAPLLLERALQIEQSFEFGDALSPSDIDRRLQFKPTNKTAAS